MEEERTDHSAIIKYLLIDGSVCSKNNTLIYGEVLCAIEEFLNLDIASSRKTVGKQSFNYFQFYLYLSIYTGSIY